jgi:hypothetical protein
MAHFNKEKLKKLSITDLQSILTYYETVVPTTRMLHDAMFHGVNSEREADEERWIERCARMEEVITVVEYKLKALEY